MKKVEEPSQGELDALLALAIAEDRQLEVLERYRDRKISRARAAALLKMSERQVNRLMDEKGFARVEGERTKRDEQARLRRELRTAAAKLAAAEKLTPEQAATRAGCSVRTIYRYMKS